MRVEVEREGAPAAMSERGERPLTRAERLVARCLPSAADLMFASVLAGVLLGKQEQLLDGDSAWNLRIGGTILDRGLPRTEFLLGTSYGRPVVYWEWLAQAAYAGALRLGGLNAVAALAALLVALTAVSLYAILRRRGASLPLALGLTYAAVFLTSIGWTARAQLFTLLLVLWWTEWLWRYWRDGDWRRLWAFPVVAALWVNLHPGVLEGLLVLGVGVAVAWLFPASRGRADARALTAALLGSVAATVLTPWGPGLDAHILATAANPVIARAINEYQSPDFHDPYALLFLLLALGLVAAWLRAARRNPRWRPEPLALALAGVWTVLAFYSLRFVPLWGVVVAPMLAEALGVRATDEQVAVSGRLARRLRTVGRRLRTVGRRLEATDRLVGRGVWAALALGCLVLALAAGGIVPGTQTRVLAVTYGDGVFPVGAAALLKEHGLPAGRGFTTDAWGSYLEYALPAYRPFVDTRQDVESPQLLLDYVAVMQLAPGWQRLLDAYGVRWALLPRDGALTQMLGLTTDWRCSSADDAGVAALCVRT